MINVPFVKMHGAGNDFVVIDFFDVALQNVNIDFAAAAEAMCRRCFSIGADGLIAVVPEEGADCRMRIFNADGSEAQMCGNGIRCVARLLYERGYMKDTAVARIATLAGLRTVQVNTGTDGEFLSATVDMGTPEFDAPKIPAVGVGRLIDTEVMVGDETYTLTAVSMGNPHGVVFVEDVDKFPVEIVGRRLELCALWPEHANIEFAQLCPDSHVRVRVWERGVGETLACGTGACAVAAAAIASGRGTAPLDIELPGGVLNIAVDACGHLLMTGPAEHAFRGFCAICQ